MIKRVFLVLVCSVLVCSASLPLSAVWAGVQTTADHQEAESHVQEVESPPFRFIVFGDTRPTDKGDPPAQLFIDIIKEINLLHPELVVHTGDQIFGFWEDPDDQHAEWDTFDELWATIECPKKYKIVGNHDIYFAQDKQIYIQRYGPDSLYYSFNAHGCHFVMLNTEDESGADWGEPTWIRGEQLEWLQSDLKKWEHMRTFVFLHRPLWKGIENPGHWRDDILPVLKQYNVDTVFAGHWHAFAYDVEEDIPLVVTGGGGAPSAAHREHDWGMLRHLVLVTVPTDPKDRSEYTVIRTGGILGPDKENWIRREGYWFDLPGAARHKVTSTLEQP